MTLSKSKLREVKLRKKKRAIIASRNVNNGVNNLKKGMGGDNGNEYSDFKLKKNPQPKRLHHSYKKWKWVSTFSKEKGWYTERKLIQKKSEYFHEDPKKMTQHEYWEKLVQYKLTKWDSKHPKPVLDNDLFKQEDLTKWNAERDIAEERIRDFVVSVYDKLHLVGRFKTADGKFEEKEVAVIKDINGEGHNVNNLPKDSKLLKKVQKITDTIHAKHMNLVSTNLKDHKQQKGRIFLPTNLMMMRKAA